MSRVIDAAEIGYENKNLIRVILVEEDEGFKVFIDDAIEDRFYPYFFSEYSTQAKSLFKYAIWSLSERM